MHGNARYGSRYNPAGGIVQMRIKGWAVRFKALDLMTESCAEMVHDVEEQKEATHTRESKENKSQPTWHHFQIVWQLLTFSRVFEEPDRELNLVIIS